jgi:hypothetical protein
MVGPCPEDRAKLESFFPLEEIRIMTDKNQTGKDLKTQDKPLDDSALKATKSSEVTRELTDDEIAAVAGGGTAPVQHKAPVWTPFG